MHYAQPTIVVLSSHETVVSYTSPTTSAVYPVFVLILHPKRETKTKVANSSEVKGLAELCFHRARAQVAPRIVQVLPSTQELDRTAPSRTIGRSTILRIELKWTEPNRTEPNRTEPNRTAEMSEDITEPRYEYGSSVRNREPWKNEKQAAFVQ